MSNINTRIAAAQDALLDIPIGMTRVVLGHAVTRWTDDEFEVGTWGRDNKMGSEHAAEMIVDANIWTALAKEFPTWSCGDLADAALSTSPTMSPAARAVQDRFKALTSS